MKTISDIPREHLIEMLKEAAWYSDGRTEIQGLKGYSFDVNEETCIRDVVYRDEELYTTAEEALLAHWQRHYQAP